MKGTYTPTSMSVSAPVWRDQIFWFVMVLVFVYAGVYNCLPVTFPIFKRVFGTSLEQMGRSQSVFFVSGIVFSLCGGWMIGRIGLIRGLIAALLAISASLTLIGTAPEFSGVLLGAFCFGLAMTALSVIYSSLISRHFGEKRQSVFFLAGLADGSGAVVGTAALGAWFAYAEGSAGNWRLGYYVAAGIVAVQALWAWALRSDEARREGPHSTTSLPALSAMKEVLRSPDLYAAGILVFLHGLAQGGMVSFVGQLYQKRFAIDAAIAAYFISLNSGGQFGGRFVLSWITSRWRIHELVVLSACAMLATLAFVATILSPGYVSGLAMFMLAGIFVSGNGPSLNSYVGMRFQSQLTMAYALYGGFSGIGAAVGPYLIGALGNAFGLEASIWFGPVASLSLAVVSLLWFLREKAGAAAKVVT